MSIEDAFTMRVIVTSLAGGVVVFVALMLIRSIISGGKRVVWEILRVTAGLVCTLLVGLSSRGNIGSWGAWALSAELPAARVAASRTVRAPSGSEADRRERVGMAGIRGWVGSAGVTDTLSYAADRSDVWGLATASARSAC